MSLSATPAAALIFLQLAPARSVLALMQAPGMLLILILLPGASGAFPCDSLPLLCARAWGDLGELGPMDHSAKYVALELLVGPLDSVPTDGSP